MRKSPKDKGIPPVTSFLKNFEIGEKASIVIESSSQKGQPHRRFQGMVGTIVEKRGAAYVVRIDYEKMHKDLIVRPEHLRKFK